MKIFYKSTFEKKEILPGETIETVPDVGVIKIVEDSNEPPYIIYVNGELLPEETHEYECDVATDIVVKQESVVNNYKIRPLAEMMSRQSSTSYSQFEYEFLNSKQNEIQSIISGKLKLYAVEQNSKVRDWTSLFNILEDALPTLKRICDKPKSHLKSANEVRPIETVKRVGYESIPYLASHSEDWLARTVGGLKPARLFSRVEEDDYQIYENRATKTLIERIIRFLRIEEKSLLDQYEQLHGIINSGVHVGGFGFDESFQKAVNEIISKENDGDTDRMKSLELADQLHRRAKVLLRKYRALRKSKLFRHLHKTKPVSDQIRTTNILLMDRNYNTVYELWKRFFKETAVYVDDEDPFTADENMSNYLQYCKTICGYAAHVLNFTVVENGKYIRDDDYLELDIKEDDTGKISIYLKDIERRKLKTSDEIQSPIGAGLDSGAFSYDGSFIYWKNNISESEIEEFASLHKTSGSRGREQSEEKKRYQSLKRAIVDFENAAPEQQIKKITVVPSIVGLTNESKSRFENYMRRIGVEAAEATNSEYVIVALPECGETEQKLTSYAKQRGEHIMFLPVTMYDINSFRRIQNVLLRLILTMRKETCPYCGGHLRPAGEQLVCDHCNQLVVTTTQCPNVNCKHKYTYLSYQMAENAVEKIREVDPNNFYLTDSLYQYKDVVHMYVDEHKIRTRCPYCGK